MRKPHQGQADTGMKENFTPKCALCLESIIGSLSVKKLEYQTESLYVYDTRHMRWIYKKHKEKNVCYKRITSVLIFIQNSHFLLSLNMHTKVNSFSTIRIMFFNQFLINN